MDQSRKEEKKGIEIVGDISKFIREDKNINQSLIINEPQRKPAEAQVQTEDPNMMRSSYLVTKVIEKAPQLMNQQNFRRTI